MYKNISKPNAVVDTLEREMTGLHPSSLALLTDLYQMTMADTYWRSGMADHQAAFHVTFRDNPFEGGFAVACGLQDAIDYINHLQFPDDDVSYPRTAKWQ
jgi:nicotinate phosphoribosyltransferase